MTNPDPQTAGAGATHPISERATLAFVLLLVFLVDLSAVCPTVHLGDSGELSASAATLGIPHVPGYPVFTQLAFAVTRLPMGAAAFRTNLYSSLTGLLAVALLYILIARRTGKPRVAAALSLAFAGGQMFLEQSLKVRVYPLNTAFAIALVGLTLHWRYTADRRALLAAAFLGGLGMGNHQILMAVGVFPVVLMIEQRRRLHVRDLILAACLFVVGLSVYAYLPLRAAAEPVMNWGDPYSWPRFVEALTQKQYAGKMMTADWGPKLRMAGIILQSLLTQAGVGVFALGVLGALSLIRRDPVLLVAALLVVVANIAIRINYIGRDEFFQVLRYTINATFMLVLLAAEGARELAERLPSRLMTVLLMAVACLPFAQYTVRDDLSHHYVAEDFVKASLSYPEPAYALAVGGDDNIFPLWYIQRVERYRQEVVPLPREGFDADWIQAEAALALPAGTDRMRPEYRTVPKPVFYSTVDNLAEQGFPVYSLFSTTDHPVEAQVWAHWQERGTVVPCGLGFRIDGRPCDDAIWNRLPFAAYTERHMTRDHHTTVVLDNVVFHLLRRAREQMNAGRPDDAYNTAMTAAGVLPNDPAPIMHAVTAALGASRSADAQRLAQQLAERYSGDERVREFLQRIQSPGAP